MVARRARAGRGPAGRARRRVSVPLRRLDWTRAVTRHLLFAGKGGVGKTTVGSATAVALADEGSRVLVVSTDPASNLDDVFGRAVGQAPTPIGDVSGLFAVNIDPEAAAAAYRDRTLAPFRGVVPPSELAQLEEQLSGQCTVEVAAFDQFSLLLGSAEATRAFDHIIFDTAPTGHTLRLLSLPAAWSAYLEEHAARCELPRAAGIARRQARPLPGHRRGPPRSAADNGRAGGSG